MFRFLHRKQEMSPHSSPRVNRRPAKTARLPIKAPSGNASPSPDNNEAGAATTIETPQPKKSISRTSRASRSRASKSWDVVIVNSDCGGENDVYARRHSPLPSYQQPPGFDDDGAKAKPKPSLVKQASTDSGIVPDENKHHDDEAFFPGSDNSDEDGYVDLNVKTDASGNTIVPPVYKLEPRPRTDSIDSEYSSDQDAAEPDVYQEARRHKAPHPPPRQRGSPSAPTAPAPPPRPSRPSLSEGADSGMMDNSPHPVSQRRQSYEHVATVDILSSEWNPNDLTRVIFKNLSRDRAETLLKVQTVGAFLLRSSHEIVVLSAFDGANVHHLQLRSEGLLVKTSKFEAQLFCDFVRHYSTNKTDLPMKLNTLICLLR